MTTIPVLDAPATDLPVLGEADQSELPALHRDVLATIRRTIACCAHPGCLSCHELAAVLDDYLLG